MTSAKLIWVQRAERLAKLRAVPSLTTMRKMTIHMTDYEENL